MLRVLLLFVFLSGVFALPSARFSQQQRDDTLFYRHLLAGMPDDVKCPTNGEFQSCSTPPGCTFEHCCGATPLHWFGDTCECAYNCINCHGGTPLVLPPSHHSGGGPPDSYHKCACEAGKKGIDCRECIDNQCTDPQQKCSHEMYFKYEKIYDCISTTYAGMFAGRFIWEAKFPVSGGGNSNGILTTTLYNYNASGPIVMNCTFSQCEKSYGDAGLTMDCSESQCCTQGWALDTILALMNMVKGPSIITIGPTGIGKMSQKCMPLPITFKCEAYGCEFAGQDVPPMSVGEKAGLAVAGSVLGLILILTLVAVFVCARKQKQLYLDFGSRKMPMTLTWRNVSCVLKLPKGRSLQPLRDMQGEAHPGTIVAIMGESGAGKTSLLDMLAGRKTVGELGGEITVNGRPRGKDWQRISGYVMQDDLMLPSLTVRETVLFSARLRLPSIMNDAEREERTDSVIAEMGLTHVAETLVGNSENKGISGGERKRLAIAVELVTNPSLLFLDEPTSGLDSANALRVVRTLAHLAKREKKTIVFSIHQPASQLFALFDTVHLLAKGRLIYSGPSSRMLPFFTDSLRFNLPDDNKHFNPADYVIHQITAIDDMDHLDRIAEANRAIAAIPEPSDPEHIRDFKNSLNSDPTKFVKPTPGESPNESTVLLMNTEESHAQSLLIGAYPQPFIIQCVYLSMRSLKASWRSKVILVQYATAILTGLVLGGLYFQLSLYTTGVQNRTGVILFVVVLLSVLSLTSIDTFLKTRNIYLREKNGGYFSSVAFFTSLTLADVLVLRLIPPLLTALSMYWMVGLHAGAAHFLWFAALLFLTSFCSTALCLLISSAVKTVALGNLVAILVLVFSILFSGLLLNFNSIPYFFWLRYLSFVNFSFEALMINELVDLTLIAKVPGEGGAGLPVNGAYYLAILGLDPENFYMDVYLLIGYGIALYAAAFGFLLAVKEKR